MRQMQGIQNTVEGKVSARQTSMMQYFPVVILQTNHKRATSGIVLNTKTHQTHPCRQLKAPKHTELPTHSPAPQEAPPSERTKGRHGSKHRGRQRMPPEHRGWATAQPALPAGQHRQEKNLWGSQQPLKLLSCLKKKFLTHSTTPTKKGLSLFLYKYVYYLTLENNSSITSMQNQTRWRAQSGKKIK